MRSFHEELENYNRILLNMISAELFHVENEISSVENWNAVWREACGQATALIAFSSANCAHIPPEVLKRIKKALKIMLVQNIQVNRNHTYIHELMTKNEIPYVVLKGCASAAYYPDPIMRMMGDVDFLVSPEDVKRAGDVLQQEGFAAWDENHICHIVYNKGNIRTEMHFEPSGIPHGEAGKLVREYLKDTIDTAVLRKTENGAIMIPDDFHHGLIILLHTAHHMTSEGIGLRHLCDWAVFVNGMSNQQFVDLFETKLKRIGMWRFAQLLTQVCIRYLNIEDKEWVGNHDAELTQSMMTDILQGGNLGQKIVDRDKEALLISSQGKDGVGKTNLFKQFIISINDNAYIKWPIMKKAKILLPIGWMRLGMRYIRRRIRRERPSLDVGKMIKGAAQRKEIYKQFHLFEV